MNFKALPSKGHPSFIHPSLCSKSVSKAVHLPTSTMVSFKNLKQANLHLRETLHWKKEDVAAFKDLCKDFFKQRQDLLRRSFTDHDDETQEECLGHLIDKCDEMQLRLPPQRKTAKKVLRPMVIWRHQNCRGGFVRQQAREALNQANSRTTESSSSSALPPSISPPPALPSLTPPPPAPVPFSAPRATANLNTSEGSSLVHSGVAMPDPFAPFSGEDHHFTTMGMNAPASPPPGSGEHSNFIGLDAMPMIDPNPPQFYDRWWLGFLNATNPEYIAGFIAGVRDGEGEAM